MERVLSSMLEMSLPAISGAAIIADSETCSGSGRSHAAVADLQHIGIVPVARSSERPQGSRSIEDLEQRMDPLVLRVPLVKTVPNVSGCAPEVAGVSGP